ncbi:MAG: dephospho-CoA kinase [Bacteroidetes bacterium]|nr:dephospho-CoA kinase [Bacteroidota bacterium]
MIRIGLTGNMGSGKSLVSKIFSQLGVPVFNADYESKKFLADKGVKLKLLSLFSTGILDKQGEINKKTIASLIFSDTTSLMRVNAILHPLVMNEFMTWCNIHHDAPYVILEAAIIFESHMEKEFDGIIYITCPKEQAILRIIERDHAGREDILSRMKYQWDDEKKITFSQYVIQNDDQKLILPRVIEIHRTILDTLFNDSQ